MIMYFLRQSVQISVKHRSLSFEIAQKTKLNAQIHLYKDKHLKIYPQTIQQHYIMCLTFKFILYVLTKLAIIWNWISLVDKEKTNNVKQDKSPKDHMGSSNFQSHIDDLINDEHKLKSDKRVDFDLNLKISYGSNW